MIDAKARAVLDRLERQDALERDQSIPRRQRLRQVTPDVGRLLHTLVLATRPSLIVEIGTSGGYSTVWLATAARAVRATVLALEIDSAKVDLATSNLRRAGVHEIVTVKHVDAFDFLRDCGEPLDFVFLDAEKEDYLRYLELIVSLLPVGGLLVADNLISHADELADFRERAQSHPDLSAIVIPVGRGELLAVKIR